MKTLPKPCPFCGEDVYEEGFVSLLITHNVPSPYRIHCCCGAEGPWARTEGLAIAGWNKRKGGRR